MYRFKIISIVIAFIVLTIWSGAATKSYAISLFHDDFNGNTLDGEKWTVDLQRGVYTVNDGYLYLNTIDHIIGYGVPAISTKYDPFPADSDWTFSTNLRFLSSPNTYPDGVAIYAENSNRAIAYIWQNTEWGSPYGGKFSLWDGVSENMKRVWFGDTASIAHTFTLERSGDYYNAFVDGLLAGSVYNTAEAGRLVIGNSELYNMYDRWNPVLIDYVDVSAAERSGAVPAPEPGTLMLTVSGMIGIISARRFLKISNRGLF